MIHIETSRRAVEAARGWSINPASVQLVEGQPNTWMALARTTKLGDVGVPERQFAIHVVGTAVSDVHGETIEDIRTQLAERETGRRIAEMFDPRHGLGTIPAGRGPEFAVTRGHGIRAWSAAELGLGARA